MWIDLAPLILVSAALPLQTLVTLLLARSSIRSAWAWVAGMTAVRLLQGVLFGAILEPIEAQSQSGPRLLAGTVLLVSSLLLYVKALRTAVGAEDEDAPPPLWVRKAGSMPPLAAFGAGAVLMLVSVKFLVFTLGAIGVIADAHMGIKISALTFLLFVLLAQSPGLAILALATSSSSRSTAILDGVNAWLQRNNRMVTILFGVVFGTWFLLKALNRLEVI
ncbi:MAG: GAP family protein [Candidatus Polarisedimenticolia bacterium]